MCWHGTAAALWHSVQSAPSPRLSAARHDLHLIDEDAGTQTAMLFRATLLCFMSSHCLRPNFILQSQQPESLPTWYTQRELAFDILVKPLATYIPCSASPQSMINTFSKTKTSPAPFYKFYYYFTTMNETLKVFGYQSLKEKFC